MESEQNVVRYLAQAATRCGSRTALVLQDATGNENSVTFAELWERVDRTSVGLRQRGLQPGDRAIIMIPMSIDLYTLMLAILKCAAIAVFVDPWVGRKQIAAFARYAEASAWIGIPKSQLLRLLDSSLRKIPLTVTTGSSWLGLASRYTLEELQQQPGDDQIAAVDSGDTAMITFTSGSSGLPKGVNRTHGFLSAQHEALQQEFPQTDVDIDMPMFPVFALNNLARGIPSIIPAMDFRHVDRVDGSVIAEQLVRNCVTTCTASPPFLDRLAEHERGSPSRRISLRRILTGGAPVTDGQLKKWREVWPNTQVIVAYGSTEAEPVARIDADERVSLQSSRTAAGYCIGKPSELVRLRIVRIHDGSISLDGDGWKSWELPRGEAGEIIVSGDHVAQSYFQNPEATSENKILDADNAVWHRMGDTGYIDEQGHVWLVGRVHSTIHRAGRAVHPQLVEQAGAGNDSNLRVAAVGLPDDELGQRVVAVVETTDNHDVLTTVRQRIETARLPVDEVRLARNPLPLDPRHRSKIDYSALRENLRNQHETPETSRNLTSDSPFLVRLWAYLQERFPLAGHGLLIVSFYSCNQFLAQALTNPGAPMQYSLATIVGALTLLAVFFHLRVFDEHKDYEEDCRNYPERVLQRGLITLRDITILGGLAIAFELTAALVWAGLVSPAPLVSVIAVLVFSLLMLKEFFVGAWLRKHFLLYATSHMLIMPLMVMIVFSYTTNQFLWQASGWYWFYAFVGFFVTFNWEISRKIRDPSDEREGVDTYTKILGTYGAAYAVLVIRVIDTAMVAVVGYHLGLPWWFYAILIALYGVCLVGFFQYRFHTSRATAKRMELYAGMYIIAFDITLALALGSQYGVTFRWTP